MEEVKIRNLIENTIEDYQKKTKSLSVFVSDLKKQEKFFRNSDDKYLHATIEGELRVAETRKEAFKSCLDTMKTFLA